MSIFRSLAMSLAQRRLEPMRTGLRQAFPALTSDSRRTRAKSWARLSRLARAAMSEARASSPAVGLSGMMMDRTIFSPWPSPSRSWIVLPRA